MGGAVTVHITLWNILAVVGGAVWVIFSFYLAFAVSFLTAMGGDDTWGYIKSMLSGVLVLAVMIGGPLAFAAWTGAWS